jgi:preprotein translocase subunit SecA
MEGRTGRRGQPGSSEAILSLEDPLLGLLPRKPLLGLARRAGKLGHWYALALFATAQSRAQRSYARDRRNLLAQDKRLGILLAFSGGME